MPTLELRSPQRFTDREVKRMQFEDACRLQRYFDAKPPRVRVLSERAASTDGRFEAGQARVLVPRGRPLNKLRGLLQTHYREVPPALWTSDVTVTTDFIRRIPRLGAGDPFGRKRGTVLIPSSATITMTGGGVTVAVAYHPCLGELLFGRRTYQLRARLLGPAPKPRPRRVQPRPPRKAPARRQTPLPVLPR